MSADSSSYKGTELELKCINTIRAVSADQPQAANSGHPGAPMGCAPMAHVLWTEVMKYSSQDSNWMQRDRFVLSNGHACALQYTMLHLTGYKLTLDDLKQFRRLNSKTPGHPECFLTDGIEVCTGPLGQGISNAVGMAMAERHLAATYNTEEFPVIDNYTYVICGDGCLQEGVSGEAGSLAGHWKLGKLLVLYDDNDITIDGSTDLSFSEDVLKRYEAYGWHVQSVTNVTETLDDLRQAISAAQAVKDKPSLIAVKTVIGYGSPTKAGTADAHGAPLGADELAQAKVAYGLPPDKSFYIPQDVQEFYTQVAAKGEAQRKAWSELYTKYAAAHPDKAAELQRRFARKMPDGLLDSLSLTPEKDLATRKWSEACLNALAPSLPEMVGGSADLSPSNCTRFKGAVDFQTSPEGRYIRFGVREHAMSAICNGIFAYGGFRPYCATFLTFVGYMIGAMRLSALSRFGVLYIMTHDSIGLGEDGPTHQPIETLATLRSMPNMMVWRPADAHEMAAAYHVALASVETPSVICCTRGTAPNVQESSKASAMKGAYTCLPEDKEKPLALILLATGSEVGVCINAAKQLTADHGIVTRVVSMPCQEVFLEQSVEYQRSVLPGSVPTLSVEAAGIQGWHAFSHAQIGMTRFGASADASTLFEYFGFSVSNVVAKGQALVDFYKGQTVPDLHNRPKFDAL